LGTDIVYIKPSVLLIGSDGKENVEEPLSPRGCGEQGTNVRGNGPNRWLRAPCANDLSHTRGQSDDNQGTSSRGP
jgi:hypothetical protein